MIRNFFITAIRRLLKHKGYAALNVIGLSVGLACFALVTLWVNDEFSFDRFHAKADRIYRVAGIFTDESGQFDQAVTCIPLGPALVNDLPEVEDAMRIDVNDAVVQLGDKRFIESDILGVDASFFNFFSFRLLKGDPTTALREPYSIVLTERIARKYFADQDPLGQTLRIYQYDPDGKGIEFKITGIVEDCPANSHFNYNFLFSFKTIEVARPESFGYDGWFNNGYYTYVLLKPQSNVEALRDKMRSFLDKYIGADMKKYKIYWSYFLQPLKDIHLRSNLRYEIKPTTSVTYVLIFASIGFVVLLLACVNYINLATAYSSDRFKEVGVRKVMGADKKQVIIQYLIESWLLAIVSLAVALAWIELARPLFESVTGRSITGLYTLQTLLMLIAIASLVGVCAGFYPSLVISSFRTVNVLKGQFSRGASGAWLRKSLVIFQYSITIVLLTSILVINKQLKFIDTKDLGFEKENLLILNVNGSNEVRSKYNVFLHDLQSNPTIKGVARSNQFIAGGLGNTMATFEDAAGKRVNGTIYINGIDPEYLDTYGMKLVAGRNFHRGLRADTISMIVNEATTRAYGYDDPGKAVGKAINIGGAEYQLIGVVKDFHYSSLQNSIAPTCMPLVGFGFSRIAVRFEGSVSGAVEFVSSAWKKHFPESVLDYSFAEERLEKQYISQQRFARIFAVFATISLAIACLGLFSLVSYSVESRTKEIGIRKVLGASVGGIVNLLSREFLLLIVVSCVIATPFGYFFMKQWLEGFAYQIKLDAGIFGVAGCICLLIAMITVALKSVRSAMANPVDSLRNE